MTSNPFDPDSPKTGRRKGPFSLLRKRPGGDGKSKPAAVAAAGVAIVAFFGLLMAVTGRLGVATIQADEVGVIVNYVTGEEEVITNPGFRLFVPFVQEVYTFDKTTQDFLMEGDAYVNNNHVPLLTVRAKDGSNFRIDDLRIQYELVPGEAARILHDSGSGEGFKLEWIKAHARSILRDEFGRYSAVEVADPTVYKAAPAAAKDRLNEILAPHGIRVVLIKTPNPRFDQKYEHAIEARKEADQEVERLIAKDEQLEQERAQRLAAVRKEKDVEMQDLRGELIAERRAAEVEAIRLQKGADAYSKERRAEGEALQAELVAQAAGLTAKYTKEAEGLTARAAALEQRGEVVVREAIVEKLRQIEFTLLPYSRDPQPRRLEHTETNASRIDESAFGGRTQ